MESFKLAGMYWIFLSWGVEVYWLLECLTVVSMPASVDYSID